MSPTMTQDRSVAIREYEADLRLWNRYVETLLHAFHENEDAPARLGLKLEELRNKRDCVVTKVEALKRHRDSGWIHARRELDAATREMKNSWRSVIGTLDRESQFR